MKRTAELHDIVRCRGRLMFVEEIRKDGKLGLLEENTRNISDELWTGAHTEIHWYDRSEADVLAPQNVTEDVLRTFFRLEMTPWQLARMQKYPFAEGISFELSEEDLKRALTRLRTAHPVTRTLWKRDFLNGGHVICAETDPAGFSLHWLWQQLSRCLEWYTPDHPESSAVRELWEDYRASKGRPASQMSIHGIYRSEMVSRIASCGGALKEEQKKLYVRLMEELCGEGETWALKAMAREYLTGSRILPRNEKKAKELFEKLYRTGNREAAMRLGVLSRDTDRNAAYRYLTEAGERDLAEADLYLADLYIEDGKYRHAQRLLERILSRWNDPAIVSWANLLLSEVYASLKDGRRDPDASEACLIKAMKNMPPASQRGYDRYLERLQRDIHAYGIRTPSALADAERILRTVRVTAAVIVHDGRVLATQRGTGDMKGGWEFPGGKIEPGEYSEETVIREIREELDLDVEMLRYLTTVEYEYNDFHLSMDCFVCVIEHGTPVLKEHEAARWLLPDELDSVDWLPADRTVLPEIKALLEGWNS